MGHAEEPNALLNYEFLFDVEITRVGFMVHDSGLCGCSPDALVGDDGGVQIKSVIGATQVSYHKYGKLPTDYVSQCHGELYVTGREWWDFFSYCPPIRPFVRRIYADSKEHKKWVEKWEPLVEQFNEEVKERVRISMGTDNIREQLEHSLKVVGV